MRKSDKAAKYKKIVQSETPHANILERGELFGKSLRYPQRLLICRRQKEYYARNRKDRGVKPGWFWK